MATAADEPGDRTDNRADSELGGETVCWAHLVCPVCGRMATTARPDVCEFCAAEFPD